VQIRGIGPGGNWASIERGVGSLEMESLSSIILSKTSPIWSPFLNLLPIEFCEYIMSEGFRFKFGIF
jgi:hypothetical protein